MDELFFSAAGCLVLGIMTTLHPCPLAANISAISLLSGSPGSKKNQIILVIFYSLGYMFMLLGIAVLINFGLISIPRLSVYLQSIMSSFLGPMLIFVGMVLTEMIKLTMPYKVLSPRKNQWKSNPHIYFFLIGALLALSFCPATAFIYFGIMIPLSVNHFQIVLYPMLYALGALLPIIVISILINRGLLSNLKDKWTKKIPSISGWILILTGIYITLEQLYF